MIEISPSQIEKWRRCQRAYLFEYVEGMRPPPSDKQQFGTEGHARLAGWLKNKIPIPDDMYGKVAKQAVDKNLLPPPSSTLFVEEPIKFELIPGIWIMGIADCIDLWDIKSGICYLYDHKFTSSLRWAKTQMQLACDPQAVTYALNCMIKFNVVEVRARWIYYVATNPADGNRMPDGCKPVDVTFSATDPYFLGLVDGIEKDVLELSELRSKTKKIHCLDFPPEPSACGMYGGCYYQDRCKLTDEQRISALMKKVL